MPPNRLFVCFCLSLSLLDPESRGTELVEVRPDKADDYWQYQLTFDGPSKIYRAYDRIDSDGYFYLDFYGVSRPDKDASGNIHSLFIRHVRQLYYDKGNVLRFVFYTSGSVNCMVSHSGFRTYSIRVFTTGGSIRLLMPPISDHRRKVVIDPGHGGPENPGARTSRKIKNRHFYEKDLNLMISGHLMKYLEKSDTMVGIPTRTDDRYVSLEDRVKFSRIVGGDVFVSLHLNASSARRKTARGFEIYYLSGRGANREVSRFLLRRENDIPEDLPKDVVEDGLLGNILKDLTSDDMNARRTESRKVCDFISRGFRKEGPFRKHHRGVKSAPFRVLKNIHMPAVLLECGFIDHPADANRLVKTSVQKKIANLICDGINQYFERVGPKY